jgi:hypothetical protein
VDARRIIESLFGVKRAELTLAPPGVRSWWVKEQARGAGQQFGVRWQVQRDTALDRANHPKGRGDPDKSGLCRRTPNYLCRPLRGLLIILGLLSWGLRPGLYAAVRSAHYLGEESNIASLTPIGFLDIRAAGFGTDCDVSSALMMQARRPLA